MAAPKQKTARLKLKGDCSIYEAFDLRVKLLELLQKAPVVTLDLSAVERVDGSFLQLLVAAQAEAEHTDTKLILQNPAEHVVALIDALRFHPSMHLPEDQPAAGQVAAAT